MVRLIGYFSIISAINRAVIFTSVLFSVEISHFCTVGEIVTDVIESIRLNTSAEGSHLLREFFSGVPDHTLDETLAAGDGEEVNLSGRGLELHWVSCVDVLIIAVVAPC